MDLRIGGARFVGMEMKTPNGTMQMYFTGKFIDIVENRRLVYTEAMADEHGNVSRPRRWECPQTILRRPRSGSNSWTLKPVRRWS